jgi:hypothetical protein
MSTYAFALIWVFSSLACLAIAKRRHLRQSAPRAMMVTMLGPFAIPWALAAAPHKVR